MKRILRSMLVLGVAALSGCDDPAGPELQPQLIPFMFSCNTWTPEIPAGAAVLADLQLGGGVGKSRVKSIVRRNGGHVVHDYNVDVLRVAIRAGDIPGLPGVAWARGVTEPETLEARVLVIYSRTPTDADVQELQARGGHDFTVLALSKLISVTLPDGAIPGVRLLPAVTVVEADGAACAG